MKKVVNQDVNNVSINETCKNKTYYVKASNDVYKLHRVTSSNKYVFVSLQNSDCWMNGEFDSFSKAIKYTLDQGYEIFEVKDLQDLIVFLSDI